MANMEETLKQILKGQKEIIERLDRVETKLDLVYSHTAQLTEDVTMIKKEMVSPEEIRLRFEDITETQKSLIDMYGQHEVTLRSLQRRPV